MSGSIFAPPNLFDVVRKQTALFRPRGANSTGVDVLGMTDTVTGTATARPIASTNLFTNLRRIGYVSAAGAGSTAGTRNNNAAFTRSSVAGNGGFRYLARWGMSLLTGGATERFFVGLRTGAGVYGNFDPSASVDIICVGCDTGDTQFQVMHNDGAGTATKVACGASFPFPGTVNQDYYEVEIFCPAGPSSITVRVTRIDTPAEFITTIAANLPTADVALSPQVWVNNGAAGAAAVGIDVVGQAIEAPV